MFMIKRYYSDKLDELIKGNKVLVIYGPRRVGKTTLIQEFLKGYTDKYYLGFGEEIELERILNSRSINTIKNNFSQI